MSSWLSGRRVTDALLLWRAQDNGRALQVTLGALEQLHTQLQATFVEGEKEVRLLACVVHGRHMRPFVMCDV
jgi:hypothetical protein